MNVISFSLSLLCFSLSRLFLHPRVNFPIWAAAAAAVCKLPFCFLLFFHFCMQATATTKHRKSPSVLFILTRQNSSSSSDASWICNNAMVFWYTIFLSQTCSLSLYVSIWKVELLPLTREPAHINCAKKTSSSAPQWEITHPRPGLLLLFLFHPLIQSSSELRVES